MKNAGSIRLVYSRAMLFKIIRLTLITLQLTCLLAPPASAYSVLTHEAIVNSVWDTTFKPLLLKRFPNATEDELRKAHANAYGGAIIQDMGYYPFGSKFFSDLVHYVRSGDFVVALLNDAQDLNEYAFALGAFGHYWADNIGHPEAVNKAEPMLYPKLRRKFGDVVTYEDKPSAHLKVEFGFDVLEVARGNYAPQAYHDFIGFDVSKPVLERAFKDTYCIQLKDVFKDLDLALGTYRHTVSTLIPELTKAAWAAKKDEIEKARPGMTERQFRYNLSKADYNREWDNKYERPGIGARILAFLFKLLPKIGPFRPLGFKVPTPPAETLFMKSFNDTLANVRSTAPSQPKELPNRNFDTGKPPRQGDYRMADETYIKLLDTYAEKKVVPSENMRTNIIAFFHDPARITDPKALAELNTLKAGAVAESR